MSTVTMTFLLEVLADKSVGFEHRKYRTTVFVGALFADTGLRFLVLVETRLHLD